MFTYFCLNFCALHFRVVNYFISGIFLNLFYKLKENLEKEVHGPWKYSLLQKLFSVYSSQ